MECLFHVLRLFSPLLFFGIISMSKNSLSQNWFPYEVVKKYLNATGPARITDQPVDTRAQAGFFIFLLCKAQGNPKPTVQFRINGKVQKNEGHRKIIRTFDYGASLRQQVQMDNNNDRVECIAENHLGTDSKSAIITVIDSNGEAPLGFPSIITGPIDVLGQIGKSAKIRCEVSADPPAKVMWIKNSHYQLDLDEERFQIVGTGSLIIKNIKEKDNGSYECMARNKIGTVISQAGLLQIRNSPMTPQIIDFKNVIEVSVGHGANLTCNAEGYPIPNVWWAVSIGNINNQKPEQRSLSDQKPTTSTIHITDITESAVYTCFASNNMGTVRKTVNIVVKKKPLTPKSVTAREVGTTYATIDWMPLDSNPAVDSYTLHVKDVGNEDTHLGLRQIPNILMSVLIKNPDNGRVSYNLTNLKPFTKYEARVLAVNSNIGTSEPSSPAIFLTNELPPSTAPRDVFATAITHDSIAVNWKPPLQTNGRITGYKMYYNDKFDAPIGMWTVVKTSETKYYLNNLIPNSTYYVKVNAYNNAGDGPVSDSFTIIVSPGVPSIPQNLRGAGLTSTSIQIMWSAPTMPDGMTLQSYVLKFKPSNEDKEKLVTESIEPDKTQYLIQGLKPGTLYSIGLAAKTVHGTGVEAQLAEKTKDEIPGKPEGETLVVLGSTSIKLTWKGPSKMLDQVKYYIIKWGSRDEPSKNINTEEGSMRIDADKNNPDKLYEAVINHLTPNVWYKIEIRAGSLRGEGSPYIFPVEKTSGEVPSMPRGFRLSQVLRITVTPILVFLEAHLSWDPPENPRGNILQYRVAITLIGPVEHLHEIGLKRVVRNVSSLLYVTTKEDELGYGRTYLFEVSALNDINYGFPASFNQSMVESKPTAQPTKFELQAFKNTVNLRWLPPPVNYRNGIITGYKICYYNIKDEKGSKEEIFVKSGTSFQINDLSEKTTYIFMIRAVNKEGDGPWSSSSSIYISSELFPAPESVKAEAISDSKIKVSWSYPSRSNLITDIQSQIIGFIVQIATGKDFTDKNIFRKETTGPVTATVINKINPNEYFIRVKSVIRDDRSTEWSNAENVIVTKSKYSDRNIRNLFCTGHNKRIKVMWTRPEEYVEISAFDVRVVGHRKYRSLDDSIQIEKIPPRTAVVEFRPNEQYLYSYLLEQLESNTIYDVTVEILYAQGSKNEPISKTTSCVTLMSKPQNVLAPKPIPQRKITDEVVLRLVRSDERFGRISHYYLVVGPVIETHITPSDVNINTTLNIVQTSKTGNYRYVAAQFTTAIFRSKPYTDFTLGSEDPASTFQRKDWIYLQNSPLQKKVKYRAFLRACIIADGQEYTSPELTCTSSDWSVMFSTDINRESEVFTIAVIAGIAGIVLLLLVCIGFACFLKRSHNKVNRPLNSNDPCLKQPLMMQPGGTLPQYNNNVSMGNSNRHGYSDSLRTNSDLCAGTSVLTGNNNHQQLSISNPMFEQRSLEMKKIVNTPAPDLVQNAISISNSNRPAIPVNRLETHINELRANDNFLFSQEYESIDPGQQFTWDNSNMEINRCKNRYANVIAYDHSRILLQAIDRIPGSDYINANYIDGFKRPNAYIASQGPLSNTFGDFWRMVWEQGTTTIVMMTKLEERTRIKCDQYWPNKGTETYADGKVSVTLSDTKELAYYTIRTFTVSANYTNNTPDLCSDKEKREVRQYQFTAWPDHGVPENPMPLLMFLRRVRYGNLSHSGPVIVHCSAGVGRTGAFIAIDATLERIRFEMTFDIFGQVSLMRAQRNYMVQTEDQYVFVHDVVLDAVRAGNTEVLVQGIPNHVQKILRADCASGIQRPPGIELEFQKLSHFKPSNARSTSANLPVNRLKNRLVNILPYEYNRICLQPIRGCEGSDYINASYIDGYSTIKAYIATQAPLVETVEDFWRMIWEHNSTIIVMLTKLREMGREKCHRYWPTERSSRFQYFVVDPMVEYNMPNFVLQEFKVTDARDGQSRTVRQFQFTEWPEQGVPHQAREAFIDFIGQVHKTKEQFGQEGPITVHCSAGVGRTGVFMTLSIALERLRQEGLLDLFQTVRMLRYQRANMVQSEEQYRFCYLAAQEYVNSFDNFIE